MDFCHHNVPVQTHEEHANVHEAHTKRVAEYRHHVADAVQQMTALDYDRANSKAAAILARLTK